MNGLATPKRAINLPEYKNRAPRDDHARRQPAATERPKICVLLHGLTVGGAELLAVRLVRRLCHRYDFSFVCLDQLGPLETSLREEGYPVTFVERKPGFDMRCMARLAGLLRREGIRLVHAHQYTPLFYAAAARLLRPGLPILFTEHGRLIPDYPSRKRFIANRCLLSSRDRLYGVGQSVRQALIDNEGLSAARVGVIYNGINLGPFRSVAEHRRAARSELQLEPRHIAIVQAARLDSIKDHVTAVRAFALARRWNPDLRYIVIGDGPERANIEREVRAQGVESEVRLLGMRSDVPRLLGAGDIALLSSRSEGIPLTLIEAMAAALPIVSTDVGGIPEVIEDQVHGLLSPPGEPAALAASIRRLAADPALRKSMGARGAARADKLFCEETMVEAYAQLYEEMLR